MEVRISQQIQVKDSIRDFRHVFKSFFNVTVIPHKGDFIADSAFKDPYEFEVIDVTIDYDEDKCFVSLSPFVAETTEHLLEHATMMQEYHGWDCPSLKLTK